MRRITPREPVEGGFGYALGFVATTAVTVVAVAAGAAGHHREALGPLAVATVATAAVTRPWAATATAATAWALYAGFVVGRVGQLVFTRESAAAGAMLVGAALLGLAFGATTRRRPVRRTVTAIPGQRQGEPTGAHGTDGVTASR